MTKIKRCGKVRWLLGIGWVCGVLLGGCASLSRPATRLTPEGYAHHKEDMNLAIHWNLTKEDDRVTVQGYVQSMTPPMILLRSVHVTLVGYDEEEREVIRSRPVFSFPSELNVEEPPWDQGTFEVSLPLRDVRVSRFDLKSFAIETHIEDDKPLRRRW